jgi:hypothetical protein
VKELTEEPFFFYFQSFFFSYFFFSSLFFVFLWKLFNAKRLVAPLRVLLSVDQFPHCFQEKFDAASTVQYIVDTVLVRRG